MAEKMIEIEGEIKDRDALDTLRRFIRKQNIEYGTMNAELEIENYVVKFIKIRMGDVIFKIRIDTWI